MLLKVMVLPIFVANLASVFLDWIFDRIAIWVGYSHLGLLVCVLTISSVGFVWIAYCANRPQLSMQEAAELLSLKGFSIEDFSGDVAMKELAGMVESRRGVTFGGVPIVPPSLLTFDWACSGCVTIAL
ncbi:hypothetical protein CBR_g49747 [Chara braunii]|uniref:Uncharacterized protein n=1 Tax=Chara braunii TaxID=69332 RepID=A0A388M5N6_CHABU|nr:hypothetical protein CBR_g49747 [Chara braunii]|eukprot:GBG89897.1 hypothetical protein CBR_g49747 [Chara braunii]